MLCSHVDTLGEEHTDLLKQQARAFEKMADRLDKEDTNKLKLKDKTKDELRKKVKFHAPEAYDDDGKRNDQYDYCRFDTILPHDLTRLCRDPLLQNYVSTEANLKSLNKYLQVFSGDELKDRPRFSRPLSSLHHAVRCAVPKTYLEPDPCSPGQPLIPLRNTLQTDTLGRRAETTEYQRCMSRILTIEDFPKPVRVGESQYRAISNQATKGGASAQRTIAACQASQKLGLKLNLLHQQIASLAHTFYENSEVWIMDNDERINYTGALQTALCVLNDLNIGLANDVNDSILKMGKFAAEIERRKNFASHRDTSEEYEEGFITERILKAEKARVRANAGLPEELREDDPKKRKKKPKKGPKKKPRYNRHNDGDGGGGGGGGGDDDRGGGGSNAGGGGGDDGDGGGDNNGHGRGAGGRGGRGYGRGRGGGRGRGRGGGGGRSHSAATQTTKVLYSSADKDTDSIGLAVTKRWTLGYAFGGDLAPPTPSPVKPVPSSISRRRAATPPDRLPSEPSLSAPGDDSAARRAEHRPKRRLSAADGFYGAATLRSGAVPGRLKDSVARAAGARRRLYAFRSSGRLHLKGRKPLGRSIPWLKSRGRSLKRRKIEVTRTEGSSNAVGRNVPSTAAALEEGGADPTTHDPADVPAGSVHTNDTQGSHGHGATTHVPQGMVAREEVGRRRRPGLGDQATRLGSPSKDPQGMANDNIAQPGGQQVRPGPEVQGEDGDTRCATPTDGRRDGVRGRGRRLLQCTPEQAVLSPVRVLDGRSSTTPTSSMGLEAFDPNVRTLERSARLHSSATSGTWIDPQLGDSSLRPNGRYSARCDDRRTEPSALDGTASGSAPLQLADQIGETGVDTQPSSRLRWMEDIYDALRRDRSAATEMDKTTTSFESWAQQNAKKFASFNARDLETLRDLALECVGDFCMPSLVQANRQPLCPPTTYATSLGQTSSSSQTSGPGASNVDAAAFSEVASDAPCAFPPGPLNRGRRERDASGWKGSRPQLSLGLERPTPVRSQMSESVVSLASIVQQSSNSPRTLDDDGTIWSAVSDNDVRAPSGPLGRAHYVPGRQHCLQGVPQQNGRTQAPPMRDTPTVPSNVSTPQNQALDGLSLRSNDDTLGRGRALQDNESVRATAPSDVLATTAGMVPNAAELGHVRFHRRSPTSHILVEVPGSVLDSSRCHAATLGLSADGELGVPTLQPDRQHTREDRERDHGSDNLHAGPVLVQANLVAQVVEYASQHTGASTDAVNAPYPSMPEGLRQERQAPETQGLGSVARRVVELCHLHRGIPPGDTKKMVSKWAAGTQDCYSGIFSRFYRFCHLRARSVFIPSDILLASYLNSKVGELSGKTVASHASAIGKIYSLALEVRIQNSELVKSAVEAAKTAIPSEARYDDCFAFRLVDEYLCSTLAQDNTALTETTLIAKIVHLFARYGWLRPGELRGLSRERMQLYAGTSSHPCAIKTFDDARRMDFVLYGTKTGTGPNKMSGTLTYRRPRDWVIGQKASQGLDLFPAMAEYERRISGRRTGPRQTLKKGYAAKHIKTMNRFGPGYFLSLEPEKESGQYFFMSEDTIRNYGKRILQDAGVPTKYKPHSVRHAGISLLADAGVPMSIVAKKARHLASTANRVYRHPSELEHQQRAATLLKDVPSVYCEELLCCSLTPSNQRTSPRPN